MRLQMVLLICLTSGVVGSADSRCCGADRRQDNPAGLIR